MKSLTLKSPAKLNLYLKVTGRRPDGYHKLVTLFHRISLHDSLTLVKAKKDIRLSCRISGLNQELSTGEDNLIVKAYRRLQERFPEIGGVRVKLTKRIPMGAGLGGGSGNAAAFLSGMKKLYGLKIPEKEWLKFGSRLGADVAFFLMNCTQAEGRGIGDELKAVAAKSKLAFVLVISEEGLSTPRVYKKLPRELPAVSLTKVNRTIKLVSTFLGKKQLAKAAGFLENDLEKPAFALRPELKKQLSGLHDLGIRASRMTGSGPTLFSILPDLKTAQRLARELKKKFPANKVIVCSTF